MTNFHVHTVLSKSLWSQYQWPTGQRWPKMSEPRELLCVAHKGHPSGRCQSYQALVRVWHLRLGPCCFDLYPTLRFGGSNVSCQAMQWIRSIHDHSWSLIIDTAINQHCWQRSIVNDVNIFEFKRQFSQFPDWCHFYRLQSNKNTNNIVCGNSTNQLFGPNDLFTAMPRIPMVLTQKGKNHRPFFLVDATLDQIEDQKCPKFDDVPTATACWEHRLWTRTDSHSIYTHVAKRKPPKILGKFKLFLWFSN